MKLPKVSRKGLAIELGVILLILGVTIGYYLMVIKPRDDKAREAALAQDEVTAYTPTDFYTSSIAEVEAKYSSPSQRYAEYMNYGYLKEQVGKPYEAIAFYEAALQTAPDDVSKQAVQYNLYQIANLIGNSEMKEQYRGALGDEWLKAKAQSYRSEE